MADRRAGMGWMDGGVHCFPIRVYYEDTDAQGMVYHANYLRFAERARTEMLRLVGAAHQLLIDRYDAGFSVRCLTAAYHAPARLDDDRIGIVTGTGRGGKQSEGGKKAHGQFLPKTCIRLANRGDISRV